MNADRRRYFGIVWLLLLLFCVSAYSQTTVKSGFEEGKLESKMMGRDMPYRVILPTGYADAKGTSQRFAVVYLLHGLSGHYNNWIDKSDLIAHAANHKFIIVTPEGDNGWYSDSVSTPNHKYESYIVKELLPKIDAKYRTLANREHRIIAGLSMGGFGAVKFGLKYPDTFSLVGSFSGALGAASYQATTDLPVWLREIFVGAFGEPASETYKANDLFRVVREITPEKLKAIPFIYQSCGTEDFLIQSNRDFLALMNEKKILHEYREFPGEHDWKFWNDQVREFLGVAERRMKK